MDLDEKTRLFEQAMDAWNSGNPAGVLDTCTPDFEWDLSRSDIPGLSKVHRGLEGYMEFARAWMEALGPTQVALKEAIELDDGRLFAVVTQTGQGSQSGVNVDLVYAQVITFEGEKASRCEVFTDQRKARAAIGLEPAPPSAG